MSANNNSTLGAFFLGNLAAAIFYGITCVQTFTYYQLFDMDHRALKLAVSFLWILDTLQLAMVSHAVYTYAVSDFGNTEALMFPVWTIWAQMIVTTTSSFVVRCIYGKRIWRLSNKNVYLAAAIALSTVLVVGITTALSIECLHFESYDYVYSNSYFLYLSLGSCIVVDAIIAFSLCVLLYRNRTHIRRTNSLVNTLILYTICTGMIAVFYTILLTILYTVLAHKTIFFALLFLLSKLHINALLANLNARFKLRDEYFNGDPIALGTMRFQSPRKMGLEGDGTSPHTLTCSTIDVGDANALDPSSLP